MATPAADIRLYKNRASYSLHAALAILRHSPVAHVAFVHPGDGKGRPETLMNIPLITVAVCDEDMDEDDKDSYAVYLHTHKHSGLVEAVSQGNGTLTASTIMIDGMVLSPTAHDHTFNYRSATLHLHNPTVLPSPSSPDTPHHEEKRHALAVVTDTCTGYDRTSAVGQPMDANVSGTTVIKCRIAAISCKQRYGAFNGGQEPILKSEEGSGGEGEKAFQGVIPCWTQFGSLVGFGKDRQQVQAIFDERSNQGRAFSHSAAWADESAVIEGLGKKRPKNRHEDIY
ncbi:hypothetical protein I350_01851 [Cryptococcus amylolentus CBS 6273]|uniref:Uncharacterized protein n=1 Tax=Cryptococcus amylolentus CBS 6273 TaxID=1296118 RepID=A0A1E3K972_9TREE|nr:hypothetical protein I350_01851 [Cryptococcus amylolentus CBS 6273]